LTAKIERFWPEFRFDFSGQHTIIELAALEHKPAQIKLLANGLWNLGKRAVTLIVKRLGESRDTTPHLSMMKGGMVQWFLVMVSNLGVWSNDWLSRQPKSSCVICMTHNKFLAY
jgi:hypothetical protein